jgi:molybdopterin-guanine dinucleotide biosynthesis protein A
MNLLGVVLAGGKSSRMGEDKGLIEFKGRPLMEYALDLLQPLSDEIVISANHPEYSRFGYQTIPDIIQGIGPLGGMFSVMDRLKAVSYFFISCDQPYVNSELGKLLLQNRENAEIIVPVHSNGKVEPLYGVYSFTVLQTIIKHIEAGNYKLMNLLETCNTRYFDVPEKIILRQPGLFKNVNTPDELK